MKKRILKIAFVILVSFTFLYFCQSSKIKASEIFINSNPIKARIFIDGEPIGYTPVRLILKPGIDYSLEIQKDGYKVVKKTVRLKKKGSENIYIELFPDKIEIVLKEKGKIINICGEPVGKTPAVLYNIPNGVYKIEKDKNSYSINPALYSQSIRSSIVESIYVGGLATILLYKAVESEKKGDYAYSAVFNVGAVISGIILGYDIFKILKLKVAENKNEVEVKKIKIRPYSVKEDRDLFSAGIRLIGEKNYSLALEKFFKLVKLYDESQYVPISYYEIGYCYYNLKDYKKAERYFRTFVYQYPIYEMYPYGFYYYMKSLVERGQFNLAVKEFFRYAPEMLDDESGRLYEMYYSLLEYLWSEEGLDEGAKRRVAKKILEYVNYYIEKYKGNPKTADIMLIRGKILYKYLDVSEGKRYLNNMLKLYKNDRKIIDELERLLKNE